MAINDEVRRLQKKWSGKQGWPRRLNWLEIDSMRGWQKQRISFEFPIVAVIGENGSGKSTILQAAACAYQDAERTFYPSEFFPETAWDNVRGVTLTYGYSQGSSNFEGTLRKPTTRWLGQTERPERIVKYDDLNRIQPVGARVGYARIAKSAHTEQSAKPFDDDKLQRLSFVMGQKYASARMALSSIDDQREIPVITEQNFQYSGYHQGSGQITVSELLRAELPKYGLVLIDEIESSLHPRAQRRLIRDLAEQCRLQECQIILTTHSPYVIDELPLEARLCILKTSNGRSTVKQIVSGISPEFAMTKMDDDVYPECDVYVEDEAAKIFLEETLARHGQDVFHRCTVIPYGSVNVGFALGMMAAQKRFTRPTCVFIDGDSEPKAGCDVLPGGDAPEQVVFKGLRAKHWADLWVNVNRDTSLVHDACTKAMTLDHHEWVKFAANHMRYGADALWRAMCAEWAKQCITPLEAQKIIRPILDALP
ncbi:AAA family ATPase [Burkholderia cenocepacia]|uniref:ATP-dependent nuclease n=1 Tax=Burkholderia cenocepacia TaxID=95486 RepID=UPI001BA09F80|nr:AAA family ATPase [Burkholderia cenocepacia]MBR8293534.1 AAA family ATPase [Burkholderia cenocepacia]